MDEANAVVFEKYVLAWPNEIKPKALLSLLGYHDTVSDKRNEICNFWERTKNEQFSSENLSKDSRWEDEASRAKKTWEWSTR